MIDATNVGISPLMTAPVTTSYVTTPAVDTTAYTTGVQTYTTGFDQGLTVPGTTTTYVQDAGLGLQTTYADPYMTSVATPGVQTVTTLPDTTVYTDPLLLASGAPGSALPPVTSPEIVSESPLAQTTGSYVASSTGLDAYGLSQQTGYGTATMGTPVTTTTVATSTPVAVPAVPVPEPTPIVPPPAPAPQNPPVGPIMDEDFQRGRPIYDEFSEDRYRGFRFGM
jgi:hypothetical protein